MVQKLAMYRIKKSCIVTSLPPPQKKYIKKNGEFCTCTAIFYIINNSREHISFKNIGTDIRTCTKHANLNLCHKFHKYTDKNCIRESANNAIFHITHIPKGKPLLK